MSFEPNDMNTIHLGNYEEFFILYMDKELSEEQVKMVDEFLVANPDLKAEFEILMSTRLPQEEFSFDKNDLFAESMKLSLVDEELLLYIDNELPADKKKKVESELASNKEYQLQHQALLQTRLDPSEQIVYPNKKELYRRTGRTIVLRPWMRVAAAVAVIAIGGMFYFRNSPSATNTGDLQNTAGISTPLQRNEVKNDERPDPGTPSDNSHKDQIAVAGQTGKERTQKPERTIIRENNKVEPELAKNSDLQNKEDQTPDRPKVRHIPFDGSDNTIAFTEPEVSINKVDVTYPSVTRNTVETPVDPHGLTAHDDRKGSLKGFLRKATRMIEKRTGFDPANENGELLIGAVAISLK